MLRLSISYQSKSLRQPWFSLLLGLVAAALISGSIFIYLESDNYVRNGILVSGKVIRLVEIGKRQYSPEIQITKKAEGLHHLYPIHLHQPLPITPIKPLAYFIFQNLEMTIRLMISSTYGQHRWCWHSWQLPSSLWQSSRGCSASKYIQ